VDADNEKDKKEVIFRISIKDGFYDTPINETAEATVTTWTELRLFIAELAQNQNHWCFQQKSTAISKKSNGVDDNIPVQFNVPQIKVESQY
jgi:hypothetical protein